MTFEQYVNQMFIDHHDDMGMSEQEIEDLLEESTWEQRYRWLKRNGYDPNSDYNSL